MDEYPNPDEEFELMYGDELELIRSSEYPDEHNVSFPPSEPVLGGPVQEQSILLNTSQSLHSQEKLKSNSHLTQTLIDSQEQATTVNVDIVNVNTEVSKKRTIEELFGDIDDILYSEDSNFKRKKVNDHQDDHALIEHILELRKLAKERHNPVVSISRDNNHDNLHYKNNLSYQVPKYSFTVVTNFDGQRIYVRCHSEKYAKEELVKFAQQDAFAGCMGETFKDVWKEAELLLNKQLDVVDVGNTEESSLTCERENNAQLWVDLYKPQKYVELLSDESTNRILLKWFKLWDKVVFNRLPKVKLKNDRNLNKFNKQEFTMKLDGHGCPEHKVVLLCGPPGLGKTTLAHMVARHAGYNVVEVNASDDRSTESFKRTLENSTQMRSVHGPNPRPNCVVFDEIDGAPSSSIDFLIKYVNGSAVKKKKTKDSNQTVHILKRPIVCICNDVYVPALRPLRQIAFVVNFPPTASVRLAERLQEIARRQEIKTDLGALLALCEKTGNDIRSCLSLLHFLKSLNKPVTLTYVTKTNLGQKDMQKGLFAVWQDIFQFQHSKNAYDGKKEKNNGDSANLKNRMQKILQVVHAFGDYERLTQGIFENYLNLKLKDSSLSGICKALEWFGFTDIVNNQIYTLQNYSLSSYVQYGFVIWHYLFATSMWQKIAYPSVGYEVKLKTTKRNGFVEEILKGMRPNVRAFTSVHPLRLDTLPLLFDIITPLFRPVNIHLYTQEEKIQLCRIVSTMIDYNLNYMQERVPEGNYVYMMDPNIEEIVSFPDIKKRRLLPYSIKQLIAREIELEKMRQIEKSKSDVSVSERSKEQSSASSKSVPNHLQHLKPKAVKPKASGMVTKDFFGRIITTRSNASKTEMNYHNDVWYQFKEGYNNAVRKRIKVSTLK